MSDAPAIPPSKIREWSLWLAQIRTEWYGEVPSRINTNETDEGHGLGGPAFAPEFVSYIGYLFCSDPTCRECRSERSKLHHRANPESRVRATRAFRKLRRVAPAEYDIVYAVAVLGWSVPGFIQSRVDHGHEPPTEAEAVILLMSGIDKVIHFWRSA